VVVHGANWQDYEGAHFVIHGIRERFKRLRRIYGDSAYGRKGLPKWSRETCGVTIQTVNRSAGAKGFEVLPKRWVVERTIAWLNRYRRLAKDYERDPETAEAVVHIAMISLMLKRLAKPQSHF
jgi:putative transposase